MAFTDINSEDRLVQRAFAEHLHDALGWESVYAYNTETFGTSGTLGRGSEREAVLARDLRAALQKLNPGLLEETRELALARLTQYDPARSLIQHNREFHGFIRDGVPVEWRDAKGETCRARAKVIDFQNGIGLDGTANNRFLAVRELKLQGLGVPHYNRRADLVCFVNGLPLVFIELKAVYKNIRAGFDENLTDYMEAHTIPHAFHHNAFLVVSNGDKARYGSITSQWDHFAEWKRNNEKDKARLEAPALLDGMLAKERLLDLVENFILFDDSRAGGTRKIVARNHQVMGVNNAVDSVRRQEELKKQFPSGQRLVEFRAAPDRKIAEDLSDTEYQAAPPDSTAEISQEGDLPLTKRAHEDLGRLGVFWHTQGSGKSYSMAFFAEKVRRVVPGNFTFLVMTDREDLDDQIFRTFAGCGVADEKTPRASSGKELLELLGANHRFIFTLIHKFNQPVSEPYSLRDDIIVISDEAHRTQSGRFARTMRLALPNAAFIGFTGTPLFKHDHLTRRIFGDYVSRYDFRRSEEDRSTVRLVYENRGEKLGLARFDLNDRIAEAVEKAELNPDQMALLEKLLGKDYEVITADDRLDKLADDFVEHCAERWDAGKAMFVCIDKITCARMFQRIEPRWKEKLDRVEAAGSACERALAEATNLEDKDRLEQELSALLGKARWMASTLIEIIISEAQNEVAHFEKWDFEIIPHREVMKRGFQTPDGKRVKVENAFKDPQHPFRIAIICAMWLTGFDVECLSTLYLDKPLRAHNLMQAIARANRVYPGKDCGVIVDYNGMLKSLREALALYALGDDDGDENAAVVTPIEELVPWLLEALETTEKHLQDLGFDPAKLSALKGFERAQAFKDAVEALNTSDEARRRFGILAREVFSRFKAMGTEPAVYAFAQRHDNIEAIYKKLSEHRDTSDVTALLKELNRIVNEAIRTAQPGEDHAEGLTVDLSRIDFEKLREEFEKKVRRKHTALRDLRDTVEKRLSRLLQLNPLRMDYYKKYQEIIADYNREKDRATVEATFAALVALAESLDAEARRAVEEGLSEGELALFDMLFKQDIGKADRERLKQASRELLAVLQDQLGQMQGWTQKAETRAKVEVLILNHLYQALPRPPFTEEETDTIAQRVYEHVWQQSASGHGLPAA